MGRARAPVPSPSTPGPRSGSGSNNGTFTIANNFNLNGGTLHDEDGNYTMTGTLALGTGGGTLSARYPGKDLTVSGQITGGNGLTIQNVNGNDGGAVVLSNTGNNYTGNTTVTHNLRLGASGVMPTARAQGMSPSTAT